MRRLDHREPGIAGVVLDTQSLYAELICDGIHVAPEFVRLWLRSKTSDRAILVTDGISATGMTDGNYMLGSLEVTVADGRCLLSSDLAKGIETLAGSVLTMDRAVANLQRFTGASLATAVASRQPQSRTHVGPQPSLHNRRRPARKLQRLFRGRRPATDHPLRPRSRNATA
jgi:N-acetylglucosamine-6-phosphate deacetylase